MIETISNLLLSELLNINSIFISIFIFITLYFILKKVSKSNTFLLIFNFPGTVVHELSHFILGLIFLAKPKNYTLIPKKTENGYVLGSVSFTNIRWYNAIPIGMSPLILLPLSLYLIFILININMTNIEFFIYTYIISSILISSKPSTTDIYVALESKIGILFYLAIIAFIIFKHGEF